MTFIRVNDVFRNLCFGALFLFLLGWPRTASAQATSQADIRDLQRDIREQQQRLQEMLQRLESLENANGIAAGATPAPATPVVPQTAEIQVRDSVGDLHAAQIRSGEFPGSIALPGKDISLAIGGFIKTLGYYDTKAENRGAVFFPAFLGSARDDRDGGTGLSAELTRVNIDGRSRFGSSSFRGYIEMDFNSNNFTWRHGYLTWTDHWGQLMGGKYWSSFMDIANLPDGLSEPVLSGAIFARQVQFRYTRNLTPQMSWRISAENPASNDVLAVESVSTRTSWPDLTTAFVTTGKNTHFQIAGLLRRLTVDPDLQGNFGITGWGVHLSGHVQLGSNDKVSADVAGGKGLGRYMLGLLPTSGAFVDLQNGEIRTRNIIGGFVHERHRWNQNCRSTIGSGYATVENDPLQPDNALRASLYSIGNLFCSVNKYVTVGGEYVYGRRWNKVGALDNNRFMVGLQLF